MNVGTGGGTMGTDGLGGDRVAVQEERGAPLGTFNGGDGELGQTEEFGKGVGIAGLDHADFVGYTEHKRPPWVGMGDETSPSYPSEAPVPSPPHFSSKSPKAMG